MATAKDFVEQVGQIEGIAGCLLVRKDGSILGQTVLEPELYSALMIDAGGHAFDIMSSIGFSYCRHLCFNRENGCHFYLFPINNYLLGVIQRTDCDVPRMLDSVYSLVSRVSTAAA